MQRLEQDFKLTLQQHSSLDQWAGWLDNVVTQVLKQHAGSPTFPKAARQFLLKWSFYRCVSRRLCPTAGPRTRAQFTSKQPLCKAPLGCGPRSPACDFCGHPCGWTPLYA